MQARNNFQAQQQENCEAHDAFQAVMHGAERDFFSEAVNPGDWQQAGETQPARGVEPSIVELPIQPCADGEERSEAEDRGDGEWFDVQRCVLHRETKIENQQENADDEQQRREVCASI